jgi:hypothetical protein
MMIVMNAVALAAAQPAVQVPAAPSAHSGHAAAHQGRHCCCCDDGDQDRENCAEHAQHRGHDSHD